MCKLCDYVSATKVYVRFDTVNQLAGLDRARLLRYRPTDKSELALLSSAYSAFMQCMPQGTADVTAFTLTVSANWWPI